ncbi:MAG: metalloregulator ArsR/SmtB family transcription factor [Hyphomicrobiales bacterium]|nr:metalloregulator ArsR/SmtB family transcription factor [Hyphomicrobiales bacterium]
MKTAVDLLAALAEPTRLAALRLVWDGREHCVCELMSKLGATQSRMSRHMSVLDRAGLVSGRRDRQWVRYTRCGDLSPEVVALVEAALALADAPAADDETEAAA